MDLPTLGPSLHSKQLRSRGSEDQWMVAPWCDEWLTWCGLTWSSITGAGRRLICVGAGDERARKILALRGLRGVERQAGSARWTLWPNGIKCGRHGGKKSKTKSWTGARQGSGSRPESAHWVCGASPQNRWVTWLSHKTKTRGLAGGDGIQARWEASMLGDTRWDRGACIGRTQTTTKTWPPDEKDRYLTILPRGVCIFLYVLRVAWSFAQPGETSYIYSFRVPGQLIHPNCFSFSLLFRLDFLHDFVENLTYGCMEAFVVAVILRLLFVGFSCAACSLDSEAFVFNFVCGNHG
jgi:hypothetical protein